MRRLQALHSIGWSFDQLAARLELTRQSVSQLANGKRRGDIVCEWTARRIADLYNQLWDQPPSGTPATRARRNAQRRGWAPPLAWDDDTIDDPASTPQHTIRGPHEATQRADERAAEVAELTAYGLSAARIAERLGTTPRTVIRDRAKNREAAA